MSSTNEVYDSTLLGILQNEGKIASFLDVIMGFLYRRTDFYHVMESKDSKLGFPPGVAARLLIQAYEKYEQLASKRNVSNDHRRIIPTRPDQSAVENKTPARIHKEKLSTPTKASKSSALSSTSEGSTTKTDSKELTREDNSSLQKVYQSNPESHNGAIRDGYRWAQSNIDCDLRIDVPKNIVKGKQVEVSIKRKHIMASYINSDGSKVPLIDSDLVWDVNVEESMWSLNAGDCIHINLEKVQERWWEHVLVDEPKIDTQKIDAQVPMEDLDESAQSAVDQLMYDEKQRSLGLPTSKQQKIQDTLKQAWNVEGSPFKGTPYDPTLVNIANDGSLCNDHMTDN